ncbi:MAG: hypothetical protein ACLFQ9_05370 [Desulfobacterales bacterium]
MGPLHSLRGRNKNRPALSTRIVAMIEAAMGRAVEAANEAKANLSTSRAGKKTK